MFWHKVHVERSMVKVWKVIIVISFVHISNGCDISCTSLFLHREESEGYCNRRTSISEEYLNAWFKLLHTLQTAQVHQGKVTHGEGLGSFHDLHTVIVGEELMWSSLSWFAMYCQFD